MQLVLSNAQGELAPLEIGIHALHAVPKAQGKRTDLGHCPGGLSAYAVRIKRDKSVVSNLRRAAEVLELVGTSQQVTLLDKAYHLYEVSRGPQLLWPALVDALLKHGWTVADTARSPPRYLDAQ